MKKTIVEMPTFIVWIGTWLIAISIITILFRFVAGIPFTYKYPNATLSDTIQQCSDLSQSIQVLAESCWTGDK